MAHPSDFPAVLRLADVGVISEVALKPSGFLFRFGLGLVSDGLRDVVHCDFFLVGGFSANPRGLSSGAILPRSSY